MSLLSRRPRIAEIAARAGVSPATVDRVIHQRQGVRDTTAARVAAAIRAIGDTMPPAAVSECPLKILLADDGSLVTRALGVALAAEGRRLGAPVVANFVPRLNPEAQAAELHRCAELGSRGVAVQALDHALVRAAMERLAALGVPLVTMLTDVPSAPRLAYVGLDNRAAGRTAGLLMSRFCHRPGRLAIVWGGELYRSHEERESGFRNILRAERPDLPCLDVVTDADDPDTAQQRVAALLTHTSDLAGIYCVGGGLVGAVTALESAGRARDIVLIGHNANAQTRRALLAGTIDALIHQDTGRIATLVVAALLHRRLPVCSVGIEIVTRENSAPACGDGGTEDITQ